MGCRQQGWASAPGATDHHDSPAKDVVVAVDEATAAAPIAVADDGAATDDEAAVAADDAATDDEAIAVAEDDAANGTMAVTAAASDDRIKKIGADWWAKYDDGSRAWFVDLAV